MIKEVNLSITLSADTLATVKKVSKIAVGTEVGDISYHSVDFVIKSDVGVLGSTFIVSSDKLPESGVFEFEEGMEIMISPNGDVQQAISPSKPTNARTPTSKSTSLD